MSSVGPIRSGYSTPFSTNVQMPMNEHAMCIDLGSYHSNSMMAAHQQQGQTTPRRQQEAAQNRLKVTPPAPGKAKRTNHRTLGPRNSTEMMAKRSGDPPRGVKSARGVPRPSSLSCRSLEEQVTECMQIDDTSPMSVRCQTPKGCPPTPNMLYPRPAALPIAHLLEGGNTQQSTETTVSQIAHTRIFNDFNEVRPVGMGSFGRVVLVEEKATKDYCAIKEIFHMDGSKKRDEKTFLAMLRGLPHIVSLYDAWTERGSTFLKLQFCCHGSLANAADIRRTKNIPWTEPEVLAFLGQMGIALDAIHSLDVVHVDFKPANVLIDHQGNYFLSDFGSALQLHHVTGRPVTPNFSSSNVNVRAGDTQASNTQSLANTPMQSQGLVFSQFPSAPPIASRQSYDTSSQDEGDCRYVALDMMNEKQHYKPGDVFSLGISLYELMSNQLLPNNGNAFHALRHRSELNELRGNDMYSDELVRLVLRMMSDDPLSRPTMREILNSPLLRPTNLSMACVAASPVPAGGSACREDSVPRHRPNSTPQSASGARRSLQFSPFSPGSAAVTECFKENMHSMRESVGIVRMAQCGGEDNSEPQQSSQMDSVFTGKMKFHAVCFEVCAYLLSTAALPLPVAYRNRKDETANCAQNMALSQTGRSLPRQDSGSMRHAAWESFDAGRWQTTSNSFGRFAGPRWSGATNNNFASASASPETLHTPASTFPREFRV